MWDEQPGNHCLTEDGEYLEEGVAPAEHILKMSSIICYCGLCRVGTKSSMT